MNKIMTELGINTGEIRTVTAAVGDYKTIYCLSLIKKFVEQGHNVAYYSIENSQSYIQNKLLNSGIRLGKAKAFINILDSIDLTTLRKRIEIDINKLKNIKLVIIENIEFYMSDYRAMYSFMHDLTGILRNAGIACVFTVSQRSTGYNNISINDFKHSPILNQISDTVYGIKQLKSKNKLSLFQRFLNLFRSKKNKRKVKVENNIYLSVLKNRYGTSNTTCKIDLDTTKLEFNIKN